MRVSSNTLFDTNVSLLNQQQARLMQTQQQIASGRRILSPSDDPLAAARALEITQADATNTQYATNRTSAQHTLTMAESALQSVTSLIQDVKTVATSAGNGTLSDANRKSIAAELSGRLQQLMGLANSTDGLGNHLFAGFQSKTQPFVDTPAGVGYFGDDGQSQVQVGASQQMATSSSGSDVFMRIKEGNGTFVTQAAAANAGSGIASSGSVTNPALLTGHNYQVDFAVVAGATTYSVTDNSTATVVSTGNPYVSGQAISFDGMQFDIKGIPANGDRFTVAPSANKSVFKTISDLITTLNTSLPSGSAGFAQLTSSLNQGQKNLDNALDHVLNVRSSLGVRLNEIDALQTSGVDTGLRLQETLSKLQDTDYSKAVTELTQQNAILQAAQQSFAKVSGLSLFSYI